MAVKNAVHIHVSDYCIFIMILVDDIYEEYIYQSWSEVLQAHPIMLGPSKDVHIFVR